MPPKRSAGERTLQNLVDTVLDTIVDGVITINERGEIQSYNKACETLFGYVPGEVIGHNVHMLMPSPYREEHDGYIRNYRETGEAKIIGIGREVSGQRKDGTVFPMELAVGATKEAGNHAFVGIIRDITERRLAEAEREQLRQSQKMEALGQLTGGIAHDFNNLLAIILGNLDFLDEKIQDQELLSDFVYPSIEAAEKGSELTRMLLAFGRKQTLHPSIMNPNDLLMKFTRLISRTLDDRIEISLSLDPSAWTAYVDCRQLENALLNLSLNARDAMPDGGRLIFETKNIVLDEDYSRDHDVTPGEYTMIAISDTGCGMPESVMEQAFDPFFTTKNLGKGTGLGLSMVYGFVKQSAGHIKLYSEENYGTTVKIYLPRCKDRGLKKSDQNQNIRSDDTIPESLSGDIRILVVEDNSSVLKMTSSMVESLGYSVLTADTGESALEILKKRDDIDLLLSDVMLPGAINGPILARHAVKLHPTIKVLFNSGYAEHAIFQRGLLDAGVDLLSKPFRKKQLAEKIIEVLNGHVPRDDV